MLDEKTVLLDTVDYSVGRQFLENIKYVSEDIGYSRASIYQWRKRYLKEGTLGLMNHKNITPGTLVEGSVSSTDISSDEINQLKTQMQDIQLEIDILK